MGLHPLARVVNNIEATPRDDIRRDPGFARGTIHLAFRANGLEDRKARR